MTNAPKTVLGYADGDRVRHRRWGHTGTVVHVAYDDEVDEAGGVELTAEVQWDSSCVADELDLVVDDLEPLT